MVEGGFKSWLMIRNEKRVGGNTSSTHDCGYRFGHTFGSACDGCHGVWGRSKHNERSLVGQIAEIVVRCIS